MIKTRSQNTKLEQKVEVLSLDVEGLTKDLILVQKHLDYATRLFFLHKKPVDNSTLTEEDLERSG